MKGKESANLRKKEKIQRTRQDQDLDNLGDRAKTSWQNGKSEEGTHKQKESHCEAPNSGPFLTSGNYQYSDTHTRIGRGRPNQ